MKERFLPMYWHNGQLKPTANFECPLPSVFTSNENEFIEEAVCYSTNIISLEEVFSRLRTMSRIYGATTKMLDTNDSLLLKDEIRRLHIRNFSYKWTNCLFWFKRKPSLETDLYIFLENTPTLFNPSQLPVLACIVRRLPKPQGVAINLTSVYSAYIKMALREVELQQSEIGLLIHDEETVVDSTHGNLFAIKGSEAITSSLECGTVPSVFRGKAIGLFNKNGIQVTESDGIPIDILLAAEELLVVGNKGIWAIKGFENKRFYDRTRAALCNCFEEDLISGG